MPGLIFTSAAFCCRVLRYSNALTALAEQVAMIDVSISPTAAPIEVLKNPAFLRFNTINFN